MTRRDMWDLGIISIGDFYGEEKSAHANGI